MECKKKEKEKASGRKDTENHVSQVLVHAGGKFCLELFGRECTRTQIYGYQQCIIYAIRIPSINGEKIEENGSGNKKRARTLISFSSFATLALMGFDRMCGPPQLEQLNGCSWRQS